MPAKVKNKELLIQVDLAILRALLDDNYQINHNIGTVAYKYNKECKSLVYNANDMRLGFKSGLNKKRLGKVYPYLEERQKDQLGRMLWRPHCQLESYLGNGKIKEVISSYKSNELIDGVTQAASLEICLYVLKDYKLRSMVIPFFSTSELSIIHYEDNENSKAHFLSSMLSQYYSKHNTCMPNLFKHIKDVINKLESDDSMRNSIFRRRGLSSLGNKLVRFVSENNLPCYQEFLSETRDRSKLDAMKMIGFSKKASRIKEFYKIFGDGISTENIEGRKNLYVAAIQSGRMTKDICTMVRSERSSKIGPEIVFSLSESHNLYSKDNLDELYMELAESNFKSTINALAVHAPLDIAIPYLSGNPKVSSKLLEHRIAKEAKGLA